MLGFEKRWNKISSELKNEEISPEEFYIIEKELVLEFRLIIVTSRFSESKSDTNFTILDATRILGRVRGQMAFSRALAVSRWKRNNKGLFEKLSSMIPKHLEFNAQKFVKENVMQK